MSDRERTLILMIATALFYWVLLVGRLDPFVPPLLVVNLLAG